MKGPRRLRVAPATEEYLREEEKKDSLVRKVFDALAWRLCREQDNPGYELPGYNPPKRLIVKAYRFPVPRLLRLVYQMNESEVFIELAQVVDYDEQERS